MQPGCMSFIIPGLLLRLYKSLKLLPRLLVSCLSCSSFLQQGWKEVHKQLNAVKRHCLAVMHYVEQITLLTLVLMTGRLRDSLSANKKAGLG